MQKVEGSSPFSRFFSLVAALGTGVKVGLGIAWAGARCSCSAESGLAPWGSAPWHGLLRRPVPHHKGGHGRRTGWGDPSHVLLVVGHRVGFALDLKSVTPVEPDRSLVVREHHEDVGL